MLADFLRNRIFSGKLLLQKFLQGSHLFAICLLPVAKLQGILHTIHNTCRNGNQIIVHILKAIAQRQHIEDTRNNPLHILIPRQGSTAAQHRCFLIGMDCFSCFIKADSKFMRCLKCRKDMLQQLNDGTLLQHKAFQLMDRNHALPFSGYRFPCILSFPQLLRKIVSTYFQYAAFLIRSKQCVHTACLYRIF